MVIDWDNYPPGQRGKDADAFIKWSSSLYIPGDQDPTCADYMIGYVWPDTKTVFPDFFKPSAQEWWKEELRIFYEVRTKYIQCSVCLGTNNKRLLFCLPLIQCNVPDC